MKKKLLFINLLFFIFCTFLSAQMLDEALLNAAVKISRDLPAGTTVAVISFRSTAEDLNNYVINELYGDILRNHRIVPVKLDQSWIQYIHDNIHFNPAGELSVESAQSIGQKLGVQYLVTGSLEPNGIEYRLIFNAVDTERAALQSQYTVSLNLRNDQKITLLVGDITKRITQRITQPSQQQSSQQQLSGSKKSAPAETSTTASAAGQTSPANMNNNQFFIGTGLSYQHTKNKIDGEDYNTINTFSISPFIGYRFGKGAAGLSISYQKNSQSNDFFNFINHDTFGSSTFGIGIFGDFIFFTLNKFSILGRANIQYNSMSDLNGHEIMVQVYGGTYYKAFRYSTIGISITPIFEYKIFDHFALYTSIGSISFNHKWSSDGYLADSSGNYLYPGNFTQNIFNVALTNITLGFCFFF